MRIVRATRSKNLNLYIPYPFAGLPRPTSNHILVVRPLLSRLQGNFVCMHCSQYIVRGVRCDRFSRRRPVQASQKDTLPRRYRTPCNDR